VIKRIAPDAKVIDITHGIEAQDVLQGALVLANTLPYMPNGVHLAVVDPGVGTGRRSLALRSRDGRVFVGPDNGLLLPGADRAGGVDRAHELTNPDYMLDHVSRTFHGRDVFSPAATRLPAASTQPSSAPRSVSRSTASTAEAGDRRKLIRACVLSVDRFGASSWTYDDVEAPDLRRRIELDLGVDRYYATAARAFADARAGDIILYEDAYENIAVAITGGNAAEMLSVGAGQPITIHVPG
jgi:S-adenosylmethionine hydrolase